MVENLLKTQLPGVTKISKHRIGIKRHDLFHGVSQRLLRNGPQMGAATTYLGQITDNRDTAPLLPGVHGGRFASGSAANHDDVVMILLRFLSHVASRPWRLAAIGLKES
jgi:acetyl esterase/lipase